MCLQFLGFFSPYVSSPLKMEQTSTSYIRAVPLPSSSSRAATDTSDMGTREGNMPQAVLDQSTVVGSPGKAQCEPRPRAGWVSSSEASSQTLPSGGCPPARHHPKLYHGVGVLHHPKPLKAMGSSTGLSVKPQRGVLAWGPCSRAQ